MKKLITWYSEQKVHIKLIPFLLLYLGICFVFAPNKFVGDEDRYITYAKNLLIGHYSPPAPNIDLWSGRGYPAVLVPFLYFNLPFMVLRLLNAFFLYGSLILVNKTINIYTSGSKNTVSAYTILLGLYFPVYRSLPVLMTECLAWFLISIICYLFIKILNQKSASWKSIFICGISIAFLAMVKLIFGYVIILMIIFSLLMLCKSIFRRIAKISLYIFSFSFLLCLPYLIYTYTLTNKIFYWTNCSSMSLFTMSAPYPKDYGEWKSEAQLLQNPDYKEFAESIVNLSPTEKDNAFRKKALENIKKHPLKYIINCLANIGRLFFEYPYSSANQSIGTYFFLGPNIILFSLMLFALIVGLNRYKKLPVELVFLLSFIMIYLAGCSLVSAMCRMFIITLPFWTIFMFFVYNNFINIKLKDN
jgi:hypothetical protein